ncbi:MAG: hypothetical protein ACI4PV_00315 [Butyricicoccus sp.]
MKLLKNIFSTIMAIAFMVSALPIASAKNATVSPQMSDTIIQVEENVYELHYDQENYNTYVKTFDYENGDVLIIQYTKDEITSQYFVDRSQDSTRVTIYEDGMITLQEIRQNQPSDSTSSIQPYASSSGTLGTVSFEYYDGMNTGVSRVRVTYEKETGSKRYNIYGTYNDVAELVSTICNYLAIPGFISSKVAGMVISAIGKAADVANTYFIPECYLKSSYTELTYFLRDTATNRSNSFFGTQYVITEDSNRFGNTYYDGTYYPTSSWGDPVFGEYIYSRMYAYSYWSIKSWS